MRLFIEAEGCEIIEILPTDKIDCRIFTGAGRAEIVLFRDVPGGRENHLLFYADGTGFSELAKDAYDKLKEKLGVISLQ